MADAPDYVAEAVGLLERGREDLLARLAHVDQAIAELRGGRRPRGGRRGPRKTAKDADRAHPPPEGPAPVSRHA